MEFDDNSPYPVISLMEEQKDVIDKGGAYDFVVNIEKPVVNGIDNVSTDKTAAEVYTLEGIKLNKQVNELPKGIYIVNGKKVVVK